MKNCIIFCSLALLALFAVVVQCQDYNYEGTWLDNEGYTLSLCVTDNGKKLQGSYQQFGIIQGDITEGGEVAQGRWYEARNPLSPCPTGGFTFRLTNSNHFEGNFDCADEVGDDPYVWNGDRYSPDVRPTPLECAILNPQNRANAAGSWIIDPSISTFWDICTGRDSKYYSSYECDTSLDCFGYEEGFIYEDGKVLVGAFTNLYPDGQSVDGSAIIAFLNDTHLVHYQWASPISVDRVINYAQHVAEYNVTYTNRTNSDLCNRNVDIYSDLYLHFSSSSLPYGYTVISGYDTTDNYEQPTSESTIDQYETSNSSTLPICFILATIILLLI